MVAAAEEEETKRAEALLAKQRKKEADARKAQADEIEASNCP